MAFKINILGKTIEVDHSTLIRFLFSSDPCVMFEIVRQPLSLKTQCLIVEWLNNDCFRGEYGYPESDDIYAHCIRNCLKKSEYVLFEPIFLDCGVCFDVAYHPNVEEWNENAMSDIHTFISCHERCTIYMSPEWRMFLEHVGVMKKIRQCHSRFALNHLLLSGDVELNPGPTTFSKPIVRAQAQTGGFIPNLLKGKIVHEHHVPLIEDFFRSRAIKEIFDSATIAGGVSVDVAEKVKVRIVCLCTSLYNLCRWSIGSLSTTDLIVNLTSALVCVMPMHTIRSAFTQIFGTASAQTGLDFDGMTKMKEVEETCKLVSKAILTVFFMITAQQLPGKHNVDEFFSRLYTIPRAFSGVQDFWKKIDTVVEQASDFVEEKVMGHDLSAKHAEYVDDVQAWAAEVAEYSELYKKRRIATDPTTMETAGKLHSRGIRLLNRCQRLGYDRKNLELIRSLLQTTSKISDAAMRSGADKCRVRRAPLMVWFTGNSGVGKSTFTYPFILDCMKNEGVDLYKWESKVYARAPETEYWDGYLDQDYIIYDDAFQLKDSQANPSPELFEIIRLGNMFPYMLHMAGVEEKGNTFGCPKLVVMSSNLAQIKAESIWCQEAVARRIDFAYRVSLKERYRKYYMSNGQRIYMLDKTKVSKDTAIDLYVYEYQRFDPHTGEDVDQPIDYFTMANIVGTQLRKNGENFNTYDNFLRDYAKKPLVKPKQRQSDDDHTIYSDYDFSDAELQAGVDNFVGEIDDHDGKPMVRDYILHGYRDCTTYMSDKIVDNQTGLWPGYKKSSFLDGSAWWCLARTTFIDDPIRLLGYTCEKIPVLQKCLPEPVLRYCDNLRKNYSINSTGSYCYMEQDFDFEQSNLPKFYETITSMEAGAVQRAINAYNNWIGRTFKPAYYRIRFSAPGFIVKFIGILVALKVFHSIYKMVCPRKPTLYELIDEVRGSLDKAEACFKNGNCASCKTCRNAPESVIDEFYYWGVPCACYVYACRTQNERNKRIFMAYANAKLSPRKIDDRPSVQARMFDFATSCECDRCPLCDDGVCECRKVAIARGCAIGEEDCVDRVGLDALWENPVFQNNDANGKPVSHVARQRAIVQNLDHQGKPIKHQPKRAVVQNLDHQGKSMKGNARRAIVQSISPDRLRPEVQYSRAAMFDSQAQGVSNRLWPNLFRIYVTQRNDDVVVKHLGHILAVKGSVFLMNWHFKLVLDEYPEYDVVMRNSVGMIYKRIPSEKFIESCVRIGEKDACLIALDDKGINAANVSHLFQPKAVHYSHDVQTMQLLRYAVNKQDMYRNPIVLQDASLLSEPVEVEMNKRNSLEKVVLINPMSWWYTAATDFGDCGAPLMLLNSHIPTKIVGIHNAAIMKSGSAFGVPLYREEIETALLSLPARLQFAWEEPQPIELTAFDNFKDGDNFIVVRAEKGSVPAPVTTKLKPSPIHGQLIPTLTKPGYLRPFTNSEGERVDPAVLNRKKWGYEQPRINTIVGQRCTNAIVQLLCKKNTRDSPYYHVPLSTDQAIQGVDGVDGLNSINKTSSPGYPYSLEPELKKKGRGKTGWFGDYEFDPTLPGYGEIVQDVLQLERDYRDNKRPFIVWIDTMKDARIPIAKANIGKTRIFSAGPMHYCILYRKYFLPFFAHCMNNRIDNMMAPGINPVSPEWHKLATYLKQKGKHVIAGDYSNYDGKACTEGYKACYEAAIEWYNIHWDEVVEQGKNNIQGQVLEFEQFAQFLRNIAFECTTHVHLCEKEFEENGQIEKYRVFYQVMNGMPSGNPGTAITNSVCGIWMVMYCYFMIFADDIDLCTVESFFSLVYMITYGDDVCVNIHHSIIDRFNQLVLTDVMKQSFGIDFTDEQKTGVIVKSRTLPEVSFLKRRFEYNQYLQMYVAPMPEDVLLDITNWVRTGGEDPAVITVNNLKSVLGEISFISKERFDFWKPKIQEQARSLTKYTRITPIFDTYYGYLDLYRQGKLSTVDLS